MYLPFVRTTLCDKKVFRESSLMGAFINAVSGLRNRCFIQRFPQRRDALPKSAAISH